MSDRAQSPPTPTDAGAARRLRRERRTVEAMVALACRDRHGRRDGLCPECRDLLDYALRRIERCRFGAAKPTCVNCPVHCYGPTMQARIREVMRYAGPRMLWRHPVLALMHIHDGRRPASGVPPP